MDQREKLLAGGLGAAVALWMGISLYESQYAAPLTAKEQEVTSAQDQLNNNRADRRRLGMAQKTVRDSRRDSLPPDRIDAQRLYGDWCYSLAELSGWSQLSEKTESPGPLGKVAWRIPVTLTGKATREEIATFIWHFQQSNLLHRLAHLELISQGNDGDPEFTVIVRLEGVSMNDAPERPRLFPETRLARAIDASTQSLEVERPIEGATVPFRIRIGHEFLRVVSVTGNLWSVERGIDQTTATAHEGDQPLQSAPIRTSPPDAESRDAITQRLVAGSVFVKPAPVIEYRPKLAATTLPEMTRGTPWQTQLKAEGWNPKWPAPVFLVAAAPAGMTVSPAGEMTWTPPPELAAGAFKLRILAKAGDLTQFETEVAVTLREPNRPPKFVASAPLNAFIGQPLLYSVKAEDEDAGSRLTFALTGTIPPGMSIDPTSGLVNWTPPETQEPGAVAIQVSVTDNGVPANTTTQEIRGQVDDDHAQFTFLVACIDQGDSRVAWLFDRLANTKTEVKMGDKVKASDLEFSIDSVDSTGIAIRGSRTRSRLELGQHLRQAKAFPPEPQTPPAPPKSVPLTKPAN